MRNDDFSLLILHDEEKKIILKHLYIDLPFYNFNSDEWEIDLSRNVDEGHEFKLSDIAIINKKTKEHFGGWSDYIAASDGKELYIFWDDLGYTAQLAKKYKVREKKAFGVPVHIQQKFSSQLKREIAEGKNFGSRHFHKSTYLQETLQNALKNKSSYYEDAVSFLKEAHSGKIFETELEPYLAANEWMEKDRESWLELTKKDFVFYKSIDDQRCIKYNQHSEEFLIINAQQEILEYWIFPEEDLEKYVKQGNFAQISRVVFDKFLTTIP